MTGRQCWHQARKPAGRGSQHQTQDWVSLASGSSLFPDLHASPNQNSTSLCSGTGHPALAWVWHLSKPWFPCWKMSGKCRDTHVVISSEQLVLAEFLPCARRCSSPGLSNSVLLTSRARWLVWVWHCRMFNHIPGFYPVDARSTLTPQLWQPKMSADIAICSPGDKNYPVLRITVLGTALHRHDGNPMRTKIFVHLSKPGPRFNSRGLVADSCSTTLLSRFSKDHEKVYMTQRYMQVCHIVGSQQLSSFKLLVYLHLKNSVLIITSEAMQK